jgi:hypothetical protein
MTEKSPAPAPHSTELSPSEKKMLSLFALFGLAGMGFAVSAMGLYMYFLPGATDPLSIIPQFW